MEEALEVYTLRVAQRHAQKREQKRNMKEKLILSSEPRLPTHKSYTEPDTDVDSISNEISITDGSIEQSPDPYQARRPPRPSSKRESHEYPNIQFTNHQFTDYSPQRLESTGGEQDSEVNISADDSKMAVLQTSKSESLS